MPIRFPPEHSPPAEAYGEGLRNRHKRCKSHRRQGLAESFGPLWAHFVRLYGLTPFVGTGTRKRVPPTMRIKIDLGSAETVFKGISARNRFSNAAKRCDKVVPLAPSAHNLGSIDAIIPVCKGIFIPKCDIAILQYHFSEQHNELRKIIVLLKPRLCPYGFLRNIRDRHESCKSQRRQGLAQEIYSES